MIWNARVGRGAALTSACVVIAVGAAVPAEADVTSTPTVTVQGDGVKLTLRVTDEVPGAYTTKVQMFLPEATPIAEAIP